MSADFLDTNILAYLFDETEDRKRQRAEELVAAALAVTSVISYQVVQETLNLLLTKFAGTARAVDAAAFMRDVLEPMWVVMPTPSLFERAVHIRARYGISFWDALIVAAALQAGCTRLLSEDLQHGQRFESLTVENPFL